MEKQRGRLPAKFHRYVVVRRSRYQLTAESHRFGRGASLWYVAFLFQALRGGQPSDGRRGAVLSRTGGRRAGSDGAQAKKKAPLSPHSAQTACRDCPGNSAVQRREGCGDGSSAARGDRERRKTRTQLVASSCPDPGSESPWAPPPPGAGSKFRHLHPWFRGPDPETAERVSEKRSASQASIFGAAFPSSTNCVRGKALAHVSICQSPLKSTTAFPWISSAPYP